LDKPAEPDTDFTQEHAQVLWHSLRGMRNYTEDKAEL
jgi:uncharacterized protein with HEPN domain